MQQPADKSPAAKYPAYDSGLHTWGNRCYTTLDANVAPATGNLTPMKTPPFNAIDSLPSFPLFHHVCMRVTSTHTTEMLLVIPPNFPF